MSARILKLVVLTTVVLLLMGTVAAAAPAAGATVSKPVLSATPEMNVAFTASGFTTPTAKKGVTTVVKVQVLVKTGGEYEDVGDAVKAKLTRRSGSGYTYSASLAVAMTGDHAVQAIRYANGKVAGRSPLTSFTVAEATQQVHIDSNVNGWMAPALRDTVVPADTPLDIVFSTPADWTSNDPKKNGAAHFIWGDFEKVSADGLVWHTEGLAAGRYDWMRDSMPKWGTGCLVAAQQIAIDKTSHGDTHAKAYLPASISFGDVSAEGMGCDRSIAFATRVFAQTSADPLVWYAAGLDPGRYDWKCWMDECHYGTLVVDGPAKQVNLDSDPLDSTTAVAANTPVDVVFTGARMMCWRTIYFTTASDLAKTRAYPEPLTWHSDGLAPGSYEWQCWMGPQCHHGTVVVQ